MNLGAYGYPAPSPPAVRAPWFRYPSGYWAGPVWSGNFGNNNFVVTLGRIYAVQFAVDVDTVITGIGTLTGANVAGSFARLGIYNSEPEPTTLVSGSDTAQLSCAALGSSVQTTYASPLTLPVGVYWLALVGQDVAPSMAFTNSSGGTPSAPYPGVPGDPTWAGVVARGAGVSSVATTHTTGVLPAVFGPSVQSTATFNAAPYLRVKVQ